MQSSRNQTTISTQLARKRTSPVAPSNPVVDHACDDRWPFEERLPLLEAELLQLAVADALQFTLDQLASGRQTVVTWPEELRLAAPGSCHVPELPRRARALPCRRLDTQCAAALLLALELDA